jgi:hypothetical protein
MERLKRIDSSLTSLKIKVGRDLPIYFFMGYLCWSSFLGNYDKLPLAVGEN